MNEKKFYLVSFHREENLLNDFRIDEFIKIINFISKINNYPVLVSAHPRLRELLKKYIQKKLKRNIKIMRPFSFSEYISLQMSSKIVISDSGSIPEESSILNFNSIILRDTFERQEIFNKTSSIVSELNLENFKKVFNIELNNFDFNRKINEYENPDFSKISAE